MRRAALALALLVLAALAASACGAPSADLFVVQRSGADHNAKLTLLVADDGTISCDGKRYGITSKQVLDARQLARDLATQAELNLSLPPRPGAVLHYSVRLQAGTITFADTSRPLPKVLSQLELFTSTVSEQVCGIQRQ